MCDSFGVDVCDIEGTVAQVSRIGLCGVEERMDEWEQGDVICTDSPNPQTRKIQITDRTRRVEVGQVRVAGLIRQGSGLDSLVGRNRTTGAVVG